MVLESGYHIELWGHPDVQEEEKFISCPFSLWKTSPISTCTPKPCPGHPAVLSALGILFESLGRPVGPLTGQQKKAQGTFSLQKNVF